MQTFWFVLLLSFPSVYLYSYQEIRWLGGLGLGSVLVAVGPGQGRGVGLDANASGVSSPGCRAVDGKDLSICSSTLAWPIPHSTWGLAICMDSKLP